MPARSDHRAQTPDALPRRLWQTLATWPLLPPCSIHVWRLAAEHRLRREDYLPHLTAEEQAGVGRFLFPRDQDRAAASRGSLRLLLARYAGVQRPRELPLGAGAHQKPFLHHSDLRFNVSHAGDLMLFAFAREIELGVDVELIEDTGDLSEVAQQNFAAAEQQALAALPPAERAEAFYRCWTRKEALLKAEGTGLFRALDSFAVTCDAAARVLWGAEGWELEHLEVASKAVGAVAWREGGAQVKLDLWEYPAEILAIPD